MATYFVSAAGDDTRTAAQAQVQGTPWKSVAKINAMMATFVAGDFIRFNRGDTFPGTMTPTKSGTSGNPITFADYGTGAKPIITGFTDATGFVNVGTNLWQSAAVAGGQSTTMSVLVNGTYFPMGRFPNDTATQFTYGASTGPTGGTGTITSNNALATNWTGAQVVMYKSGFVVDKGTITGQAGNVITYSSLTGLGNAGISGSRFFIQGDVRTLDVQGEWFYNGTTHTITVFWTGAAPTSVKVATLTSLVTTSATARSDISFTNLSFQGSIGRMIDIQNSTRFTFTGCDFFYAGEDAQFCTGANTLKIDSCAYDYTNNIGLIGSNLNGLNVVNSTIQHTGIYPGMSNQRTTYSCIGLRPFGDNLTIQLNQITNSGYNGIEFQGNNILIQNNFIDGVCIAKSDGGAIYTWNGATTPGAVHSNRVIDGNICINGFAFDGLDNGIYMDDNTDHVTITNNTCAFFNFKGIYLHNAHEITMTSGNNTCYANKYAQFSMTHGPGKDGLANITSSNNIWFGQTNRADSGVWEIQTNNSGDFAGFGTSDNNYILCPFGGEANVVFTNLNSTTFQHLGLPGWRTFSGKDINSHPAPKTITTVSDLRFEYNNSTSPKTISLGATYLDARNVSYPGTITLQPFNSAVLILNGAAPVAGKRKKGYIIG